MNIELSGCTSETIEAIHANMPEKAVCQHEAGNGRIWIDERNFSEKDIEKAIHYLLSL